MGRSRPVRMRVSPGEFGPDATVEVDPHRIGPVRMSYSPQTDEGPGSRRDRLDLVPFEENDGRGKDRPVLVVAVESAGTYLAVQLTSKNTTARATMWPPAASALRLALGPGFASSRAGITAREDVGPATGYVWDFDDQLRSALLLDGAHVPHSDLRTPRPDLFTRLGSTLPGRLSRNVIDSASSAAPSPPCRIGVLVACASLV